MKSPLRSIDSNTASFKFTFPDLGKTLLSEMNDRAAKIKEQTTLSSDNTGFINGSRFSRAHQLEFAKMKSIDSRLKCKPSSKDKRKPESMIETPVKRRKIGPGPGASVEPVHKNPQSTKTGISRLGQLNRNRTRRLPGRTGSPRRSTQTLPKSDFCF